ncbi:MAG TPA: hypothetical protein VEA16_01590, partial [Vicinamibacterales bacterium]|nr:hypothetical protein [Vicinamibacterales bacterium]
SPEEMSRLPEFWTVEARLVDSLGTISRDLGRELNLNEFLSALAPDYSQLDYSPLLPDAALFAPDVWRSHRPSLVQFSRPHQHTAIKWIPTKAARSFNIDELNGDIRLPKLFDEIAALERTGFERRGFSTQYVSIAPLIGDEDKVTAVRSANWITLRPNSAVAEVWQTIESELLNAWDNEDTRATAMLSVVRNFFGEGFRPPTGYGGRTRWAESWRLLMAQARHFCSALTLERLPADGSFIPAESVFDARSYWLDWNRER